MDTKVCSKCKVEKPLSEFYARRLSKDGKTIYCKSCASKYQREYKNYTSELREKAEMLMAFRTLKRDIKRVAEKR